MTATWSLLVLVVVVTVGHTMVTNNQVVRVVNMDQSKTISVAKLTSGRFVVLPGKKLFQKVVVWAQLTNTQTENGWMQLEITSNEGFDDADQALAAGIAEGYLTRNTITEYYQEFFGNDLCKDDADKEKEGFCNWMRGQMDTNQEWVDRKVEEEGKTDPFWHMVHLFYLQMEGLAMGWEHRTKEQGDEVGSFDIKYGMRFINFMADVWDYVEKFKLLEEKDNKIERASRPTCSVLVKHLNSTNELFVGHNTWHEYRAMEYRFLKKYNLNYHVLPTSNEVVPGHTSTMSSYAGSIFSIDDFVTLSSGLVTTETSLFIYDPTIYEAAQPSYQVMEPVRVMAANRLARGGRQWTDIARMFNSGTYNNQWMVVDYNKVSQDGTLQDETFWVMEQLPGQSWAEDQTDVLRTKGYWGSYNRAFYKEAFLLSGAEDMVKEHGSWFSYQDTPRALIMARDHHNVVDESSMVQFMRYNDFQSDPLALVPGCSKPIPAASIASRCDLTLPDSECTWQDLDYMVGHQGYGALDMKFVSARLLPSQQFTAVAGPTHGPTMPPFSWLNTNLTSIPDYRPIEVFNFQPFTTEWSLGNINEASVHVGI